MTRSSVSLCLLVLLLAGTKTAHAQQPLPPDNAAFTPTILWLRTTITKSAGLAYTKSPTNTRERLAYTIHEVAPCHLGWAEAATGDDDMRIAHPEVAPDQDLGTVEPRSATVLPLNLADTESLDPKDIHADAATYFRVTARWAYVHNDGVDEPFGFIFADLQLAQQFALVLDHAIDLCSGPRNLVGDGCTTYNQLLDRHVANTSPPMVTYTNKGDKAITCVERKWLALHLNDPINLNYFNAHAFEMGIPLIFTLKPGEHFAPMVDGVNAPNAGGRYDVRYQMMCYLEHSVDNIGNRCADLHLRGEVVK